MTISIRISVRLIDYSHANIPIHDGNMKIWGVYRYLRNSTNFTQYDFIITQTTELMDIFPKSHMKKILQANIDQTKRRIFDFNRIIVTNFMKN